jgi:dienelactone hydrolase
MTSGDYDPFVIGPYPVGSRTWKARDEARDRLFTCEIWYPARPDAGIPGELDASGELRDAAPLKGPLPLVVFSHFSGGGRRVSSFLCQHLASHGYAVAALDHSEAVAPELTAQPGETPEQRTARIDEVIASRVPDVRFLVADLTRGQRRANDLEPGIDLDLDQVALVGHSFGGWTALATPNVERRVSAVVAIAPGGNSNPKPGILPLSLEFAWERDIPTLYLAADNDVAIPPDGVAELFDRTPVTRRRMFTLQRADHQHFIDNVEIVHEAVRSMTMPGDAAWIPGAMRPMAELCSGEAAHSFASGLTLAHLDDSLRQRPEARRFLDGDIVAELAARGIEATEYPSASQHPASQHPVPASPG